MCQGPPEKHNIYFESGLQSCPTFVISLLGKLHSNDSVLTFDAPLTHNCTYNLTVETINCLGRTNSTGIITLCKSKAFLTEFYFNVHHYLYNYYTNTDGPGFNSTCTGELSFYKVVFLYLFNNNYCNRLLIIGVNSNFIGN